MEKKGPGCATRLPQSPRDAKADDVPEDPSRGLTLEDALAVYSDQALLAELKRHKQTEPADRDPEWEERRDRLLESAREALVDKLRSGELIARGYEIGRSLAEPIMIPPEMWGFVFPDFSHSIVQSLQSGHRVEGVRVFERDAKVGSPRSPKTKKTELRGSEWLPIARAELRRRAKNGQLASVQAEEMRWLSEWLQNEHGVKRTPKTLMNKLGQEYTRLMKKQHKLRSSS